ncbi:MAG: hypothetical protein HKN36_03490 [Hellea sp.]|nr:hypothetical protein [Hellea sp.]
MTYKKFLILGLAGTLAACRTTPEPEAPSVEVETQPVQTCTPISALEKVEVPAETETFTTIVLIDNPPYDPIERREQQVRVVKEAYFIYIDSEGKEVIDICGEAAADETMIEETANETPAE